MGYLDPHARKLVANSGKSYTKSGADVLSAYHIERTSMRINNLLTEIEPQSASGSVSFARFALGKSLEEVLLFLLWYAHPRVSKEN
jgi:hypothetical protein